MKVKNDEVITMKFRVVDKEKASVFLGKLFNTMRGQQYEGVIVRGCSRGDLFEENRETSDLLEDAIEFVSDHALDNEDWDLLDRLEGKK